MNEARDWDAAAYARVSEPQLEWGREVLERLDLRGDETVLDVGCGTGRVTALLADRLPRGRVLAVDAAPSMVEAASATLGDRATVIEADILALTLGDPVDVVFSTATFHWVLDHERLFARLAALLRSGGRLVAQCGGEGNVERFLEAVGDVVSGDPYRSHFAGWRRSWRFAAPGETEELLRRAGFAEARCWLDPAPVIPPDPPAFLRTVCCGTYLDRLPPELHEPLVADVLTRLDDPPELDYVRLNIDARR
jgi:trans-aconitate 2-methyltransferase